MKKNNLRFIAVLLTVVFIITVSCFSLISHSNGNDPLITLSYLNEIVLPQLKIDVLSEVTKNADVTDDSDSIDYSQYPSQINAGGTSYTLLELTYGQILYANSIVEIIVRPGSNVLAVSPFEAQGIANITTGEEHLNGSVITVNSYCIIPRGGDGRGLYVNNEKSYILVRGEYTIV